MLRLIILTHRKFKKKTQDKNEKEWKRKLVNRKSERWKRKITEALRVKLKTGTAQPQTAIRTATSPSWTIPMKRLTQQKLKKKIGLITWREAQMKPWNGWRQQKSNAGSKHTRMKWISDETCIFSGRKMRNESSWMEPWTQYNNTKPSEALWKTNEEDGKYEINEFLKTWRNWHTTTGNDMKYNNAWIRVAKNGERMDQRWKANVSKTGWKQDLWKQCSPQQRKPTTSIQSRPARYLNGVKLEDELTVANDHMVQVKNEVLPSKIERNRQRLNLKQRSNRWKMEKRLREMHAWSLSSRLCCEDTSWRN